MQHILDAEFANFANNFRMFQRINITFDVLNYFGIVQVLTFLLRILHQFKYCTIRCLNDFCPQMRALENEPR